MSGRVIRSAPQAPRPPALATAMDSAGALAPAIGAKRIGTRKPNRSQNALVRSLTFMASPFLCCGAVRSLLPHHPGARQEAGGAHAGARDRHEILRRREADAYGRRHVARF